MSFSRRNNRSQFDASRSHSVKKGSDFVKIVDNLLNEDNINKASDAIKALVDASVTVAGTASNLAQKVHSHYKDHHSSDATHLPRIRKSAEGPFKSEVQTAPQSMYQVSPVRLDSLVVQNPDFEKQIRSARGLMWTGLAVGLILYGVLSDIAGLELISVIVGILSGALTAGFFYMKKERLSKKTLRYRKYLSTLENKTVAPVHDLALAVGESDKFVSQELTQLCLEGYFKQGRVVEDGKLFLLDNPTYEEYKKYSSQKVFSEISAFNHTASQSSPAELSPEIQEVVSTSQMYLNSMGSYVPVLSGTMKSTVEKLIGLSQDLIDNLTSHPENLIYFDRFTDYYLPTAEKLIIKHHEFTSTPGAGKKTQKALEEIESSLTLLSDAFATLLDNLNNEVARDMRSDIHVLNTMLKQEGLLEKDFNLTERTSNGS